VHQSLFLFSLVGNFSLVHKRFLFRHLYSCVDYLCWRKVCCLKFSAHGPFFYLFFYERLAVFEVLFSVGLYFANGGEGTFRMPLNTLLTTFFCRGDSFAERREAKGLSGFISFCHRVFFFATFVSTTRLHVALTSTRRQVALH